ncbi:hypothetical protein [Anaerosolibacter sp.]|uniref:hypothetical protein n=1 Tax=Anaerosolibacter sp. TaxID=1872527 RepID=UPI0039EFA9B7
MNEYLDICSDYHMNDEGMSNQLNTDTLNCDVIYEDIVKRVRQALYICVVLNLFS